MPGHEKRYSSDDMELYRRLERIETKFDAVTEKFEKAIASISELEKDSGRMCQSCKKELCEDIDKLKTDVTSIKAERKVIGTVTAFAGSLIGLLFSWLLGFFR